MEIDTRLRVGGAIEKTETEGAMTVFATIKGRGHPDRPPPVMSDGWSGSGKAMIEVYGEVPDKPGATRKKPVEGWQLAQLIKERGKGRRVKDTHLKPIFGEEDELRACLGQHLAYIERTHLTMRHMNGRLRRLGLGFSKDLAMHRAAAMWEDAVYNLTRPLKTLRVDMTGPLDGPEDTRKRWRLRTPAMAAGLTDHVWTVKELLRRVPTSISSNT